ncbi:UNVERIFIED_CONTAM: hypothetical protein HDU68_000370 [Siphonaria sp. JEL0065]|nr:hypothetical protein HDU68_000370 [Siphonaria sp. JEL0065]
MELELSNPQLQYFHPSQVITIPASKKITHSEQSKDTEIEYTATTTTALTIQYGIVRQTKLKPGMPVGNWTQHVLVGINGILVLYPVRRDVVEQLSKSAVTVGEGETLSGPFLYSGIFKERSRSSDLIRKLAVDTFSQTPCGMLELVEETAVVEASLNVVRVSGYIVTDEVEIDHHELVSWLIQVDGVDSQKEWVSFIRKLVTI